MLSSIAAYLFIITLQYTTPFVKANGDYVSAIRRNDSRFDDKYLKLPGEDY
jgi:hypothetical protein